MSDFSQSDSPWMVIKFASDSHSGTRMISFVSECVKLLDSATARRQKPSDIEDVLEDLAELCSNVLQNAGVETMYQELKAESIEVQMLVLGLVKKSDLKMVAPSEAANRRAAILVG